MDTTNNHQESYAELRRYGTNKVVYCFECQLFHVYYENLSFDLTPKSIYSLQRSLEAYEEVYRDTVKSDCRCIEVGTPFRGFRMYMSISDLVELRLLLQEAYEVYTSKSWRNSYN
ncbi:MAG: DUF6686 family protein [Bacteroidota bacterium]